MTKHGSGRWSINALAEELGVDRRTVKRRLTLRGVQPIASDGRVAFYSLRDAVPAILRPGDAAHEAESPSPKRLEFLDALAISREELLDLMNGRASMPVKEYRREHELDEDEWSLQVFHGLPLLPPEASGEGARVLVPYAERWRLLVGCLIGSLGGDAMTPRPGTELARLRGFPDEGEQ